MRRTFLLPILSVIIFICCFLSVHIILASKTNDVTLGSQINVSVDDANIDGIVSFEKKPQAYIEEIKNGKTRTRKLRIANKGSEFKNGTVTNVTCELLTRVPLSPPGYPVYVRPKAKNTKYNAVMISNILNVVPPEILTQNIMGEAGDTLTITGMFFGVKKPKIWISFQEGGKEIKLKCKVAKNFVYLDNKGKTKSCMDLRKGGSECQFVVHKKLPAGQIGVLHLANKIGETAVSFNVPGPQLTIVAIPDGGGTTDPALGKHVVTSNIAVTITATASLSYLFTSWHGSELAVITDPLQQTTTVTVLGDTTITAEFMYVKLTNAVLEITSIPEGRGTVVPPVGNYQIPTNTPFAVEAVNLPGFHFERWYPGINTTVADPVSPTTTVTITANGNLNAFFESNDANQVSLIMAIDGEGSTSPSAGNHTVDIGWPYNISAIPGNGYSFFQWSSSGNVQIAKSLLSTTEVVLSNNAIVTAHFIPDTPSNANMRIDVMGPGTTFPTPGAHLINKNDPQQLVAVAQSNAHFVQWTAESSAVLATPNSSTSLVTLTDNAWVLAHFADDTNADVKCFLSAQPTAGGTTVPSPGTNYVYLNESFEIKAIPTNGYRFAGWLVTGNIDVANALLAETTATPAGECGLTAVFEVAPTNIAFAGVQLSYASGINSVNLAWGEAMDDTTPPSAMKYHVYADTTNSRAIIFQPANLLTTLTGKISAEIIGLTPDTRYWFLVVPENISGDLFLDQEINSVATMSNAMELVSSVKILADIVAAPIEGYYNDCYFDGDYRDYFRTGDLVYVSLKDDPEGEIRKVTQVYFSAWQNITKLYSDELALDEVIAEGELNVQGMLTGLNELPIQDTNIMMNMKMHPAASARYSSLIEKGIPVYAHPDGKFMIWEVGGKKSENEDYKHTVDFGQNVSYDYSLTFEPSLDSETRWTSRWGPDRLDYIKMEIGGAFIIELQANYTASGSVTFIANKNNILTKTIAFTYAVAGVPVYQEIELSLNADCMFEANGMLSATAKASAKKNVSIGIEWDRIDGWNTLFKKGLEKEFELIFTNNVNFSAYFSIYPKISTKFYKAATLGMNLRPAFYLEGDLTYDISVSDYYFWKFDVFLRGTVGLNASFDMFSKTLASYSTNNVPITDKYFLYTQPAIELVAPTPTNTVDIDAGSASVTIDITDGTNNIVSPTGEGIDWTTFNAFHITNIVVASDGRGLEFQWAAGVNAGAESKTIYYYVKVVGDGFLGEYGAYYKSGSFGIKDYSPMVLISDAYLETALREKMSFPFNQFISVYKMMWLGENLNLANCGISNLSGMDYADKVKTIRLQDNMISDFSKMSGMATLEVVLADRNNIINCTSFNGLGITGLSLNDNDITSVEPLVGMSSLQWLDVRNNPLTLLTISNDVSRLIDQGVSVSY